MFGVIKNENSTTCGFCSNDCGILWHISCTESYEEQSNKKIWLKSEKKNTHTNDIRIVLFNFHYEKVRMNVYKNESTKYGESVWVYMRVSQWVSESVSQWLNTKYETSDREFYCMRYEKKRCVLFRSLNWEMNTSWVTYRFTSPSWLILCLISTFPGIVW
jgi:hypothetical protein